MRAWTLPAVDQSDAAGASGGQDLREDQCKMKAVVKKSMIQVMLCMLGVLTRKRSTIQSLVKSRTVSVEEEEEVFTCFLLKKEARVSAVSQSPGFHSACGQV